MLSIIFTILLFIAVLSVLVVAHEWGHFIVARMCGVHVEEFGLGFPPRAKGWKRKGMIYSLNWLPLGGFVRLKGEQGEEENDTDSFAAKPVWQRLLVLSAGVGMNLILAVFFFTVGFMIGMPSVVDVPQENSGRAVIHIVHVLPGSSAEKNDMRLGDAVVTVNNQSFDSIAAMQDYIHDRGGQTLDVVVERGEKQLTKEVIPTVQEQGGKPILGVGLAQTQIISLPIHKAFFLAVKTTAILVVGIFGMLWEAVSRFAFDGFVGPVGIATYTSAAAKMGITYLLSLMAQLSISLAVINVLPIPALDGGRVLFALIEKVRGKKLRPALENAIHLVGFLTLIILLLAVTVRDIQHLLPL